MKKLLLTFAVVAATSCAAVVGTQSAARADCGMHYLDTVFAPAAHKQEAIPLQPFSKDVLKRRQQAFMTNANVQACSDDPEQLQDAPSVVAGLWEGALEEEVAVAQLRALKAGHPVNEDSTGAMAVCYPVLLEEARNKVSVGWADTWTQVEHGKPGVDSRTMIAAVTGLKYYPHAEKLMRNVALELGVTLPAPGSDMQAWRSRSFASYQAAKDHGPNRLCFY